MKSSHAWLEAEAEATRSQRDRALTDLRECIRDRVDVAAAVRAHPIAGAAAATAGGFAAGRMLQSPQMRDRVKRGMRRAPSWAARGRAVLTFLGLLG